MDLHQVEIFCTLVKLRSFSKAARELYLTQPTVSGHIKNLETELGIKLLDRLGRRVLPTGEGEIFYRHGLRLLELRDELKQEIGEVSGKVTGLLKIGGSTIPGAYILPDYIGSFRIKHPSIAIQLIISDTAKVAEAVLSGDLSLGIIGARIVDPRLESHHFSKDELIVAVPSDHPWAHRKNVPAEALKGVPFILREEGSGTRRIMEDRLEKAGITITDLNVVAIMGSSDAVRQAVKSGLGISILSIRAVQDDIDSGRIAAIRVRGIEFERTFSIILLKGKSRSPLCKTFLEFLLRGKQSRK